MKHIKKILLFVLICALALPLICACGSDDNNTSSEAPSASTESTVSGEQSDIDTDVPPRTDLDLTGKEIKILCWDWSSASIKGYTGEILYKGSEEANHTKVDVRKKEVIDYVESEYGCTITGDLTTSTSFLSDIEAMVVTDTHEYDILFCHGQDQKELLSKNLLTDLTTIDSLKLTNSWWDQNAVKDLSIDNRLFWICGDINTYDNLGTWCVLFNKNLKQELGIEEDFYQMVKDDEWTLDAFMEICKGVTTEYNGDGTITELDIWALGTEVFNVYAHVNAAGIRVAEKDDNDLPYLTVTEQTEATYNALDKVISFYNSGDVMIADDGTWEAGSYDNVWEATVHRAFIEGRELFYMCGLINVAGFRGMDDEFGILPVPMTTNTQDRYYHTVSPRNSSYMSIPYGTPDLEELGVVIEALAMKSQELVTPEFYEIQLKYRDTRDNESAEMLDLIFETRAFDLGPVYAWGSINTCYQTIDPNFASLFDANLDAAEMAMLDTVDQIQTYKEYEY